MNASTRRTFFVACALAGFTPGVGRAGPMLIAMGGVSRGTLSRTIDEAVTAKSTAALLGWSLGNASLHAFFQSMQLGYRSNGDAYSGIYTLLGAGGSYSRNVQPFGRPARLAGYAQVPLSGTYSVMSEARGTINGSRYIQSTLTTLQGGPAIQVLCGYEQQTTGTRVSKSGDGLFIGLFFGYLRQNFATQSMRIRTNNSVLAPPSPGTAAVRYSLSMATVNLAINYRL